VSKSPDGGSGDSVNSSEPKKVQADNVLGLRNTIIGVVAAWVVKTVFITPAGWVFSLLDWAAVGVSSSIGGLEGPLATAGEAIRSGLVGPFETLRGQLVLAIGQAGLGAPVAAALVNVFLVAVVVAGVYAVARVFAAPAGGFA
jgi:hypothetical protein